MPPNRVIQLFILGLAASLAPSFVAAGSPRPAVAPESPRLLVDTRPAHAHGRTIVVGKSGDFQAALDAADPGDVIELEAGATYTGTFTLPVKPGADWIVVRSSAAEELPRPGHRVDPSHAPLMPKLEAS